MGKEISIRRLGPDDLDLLLAVGGGLFDNPLLPDQAAAFLADPLHDLLLAFDRDQAVGMCSANMLLHPDKPPAMFVNEVGTRDSHLRQGIATALIGRMIGIARSRGCQGIWLGTEDDNAAALALYRSMGADEVHGVYFGWDGALDDG